jgi:hypothetical protein
MAFLVGLGFFEGNRFRLLQPFMRDPGDEPALVHLLEELLPRFEAIISFNGRAFDIPILETRFTLARRRFPTSSTPHVDLLQPSRRMWSLRLPSCALGSLEREVLGVWRDQADVPGGEIPQIYRDYLRTGDARDVSRIFYHNQIDILSMVTLVTRLCRTFAAPLEEPGVHGTDIYALARWYAKAEGDVEATLRLALATDLPAEIRWRALGDLAQLLKRAGRRSEAIEWWQQLALEDVEETLAAVELAKVFEWHLPQLELAVGWTQLALLRAERWKERLRRQRVSAELEHRLARLRRKLESSTSAQISGS